MKSYPAPKKNDFMIDATTHMKLENVILSEKRHKKPHIIQFHLYETSKIKNSTEVESRLIFARHRG